MRKLNAAKRVAFVLCATTALSLVAQSPARAQIFKSLHSLDLGHGAYPPAPLFQAADGTMYGTTTSGATKFGGSGGTIFKIASDGTETELYTFCSETNCPDGENPFAGLIQATDGNLYGTTRFGGANTSPVALAMARSSNLAMAR